ncbi:hypothetical protein PHMEG_00021655 [Phytophthora megakarya]|uniref:Uncharacterized protein n=1 Tax=Phytophthora megakarya TaxID=4795 RepID=A0A225VMZ9_9STRA|nr:hypothetical protein PHMEG_00021655 [Phytophthora megakarya]
MYPSLQNVSGLHDILKLCVASLVKHSTYLLESSLSSESSWMDATGIPSRVELYKQLQEVQQSIDNLSPVLFEGVSTFIEAKGVAAGNITRELLESTIESLLKWTGLGNAATTYESSLPAQNKSITSTHF